MDNNENDPVEIPIDGVLDLHHFSPKDLKYLIPDYIEECRKIGIYEIRLIHGKGIGNLRRTVHSILEKHPAVKDYHLASIDSGSWGATIARILPGRD